MSTETHRAEFEAWARSNHLIGRSSGRLSPSGQIAWAAWQAAQSSQAAEIEALRKENEAMRAAAEKLHLVKIFMLGWKGSEPCKRNGMEQEVEQWITAFDELFTAMQTKEAS